MTAGDAGAAFVAGRVDAAVTWEPWLTRGKESEQGTLLVDSSSTPGLITDIAVTTKKMLGERKGALQAFYRAWAKSVDWQKEHEKEADEIMVKGVGGWLKDPATFAETRTDITFYDIEINNKLMDPANEGGILTTVTDAKTLGEEAGLFKLDADPKSMIATDIVE